MNGLHLFGLGLALSHYEQQDGTLTDGGGHVHEVRRAGPATSAAAARDEGGALMRRPQPDCSQSPHLPQAAAFQRAVFPRRVHGRPGRRRHPGADEEARVRKLVVGGVLPGQAVRYWVSWRRVVILRSVPCGWSRRRALLSLVRQTTSPSRQSPRMSPARTGVALVLLLEATPEPVRRAVSPRCRTCRRGCCRGVRGRGRRPTRTGSWRWRASGCSRPCPGCGCCSRRTTRLRLRCRTRCLRRRHARCRCSRRWTR